MHDLKLYKSIHFQDQERDRPNFIFSSDIPQKAKLIAVRCIRDDWQNGRAISIKDISFVVNVELNTLLTRNRALRPTNLIKDNSIFVAKMTDSALQNKKSTIEPKQPLISIDGKAHAPFKFNHNEMFIANLNLVASNIEIEKDSSTVIYFENDDNYKLLSMSDESLVQQLKEYASRRILHELEKRTRGPKPGKSILKRDYEERYYLDSNESSSVTSEDTINYLQEKSANRVWFEDDYSDLQDSDVSLVVDISSSISDKLKVSMRQDTPSESFEEQRSKSFIDDISNLRHNDEETVPPYKFEPTNALLAAAPVESMGTIDFDLENAQIPSNVSSLSLKDLDEESLVVNGPSDIGSTEKSIFVRKGLENIEKGVDCMSSGNVNVDIVKSTEVKSINENVLETISTNKDSPRSSDNQDVNSSENISDNVGDTTINGNDISQLQRVLGSTTFQEKNLKVNESGINSNSMSYGTSMSTTKDMLEPAPVFGSSSSRSESNIDTDHDDEHTTSYFPPLHLETPRSQTDSFNSMDNDDPFIPSPEKRMYYNNSPTKPNLVMSSSNTNSKVAGSIALFSVEHQNGMDFAFKSSNIPSYIKENKKFRFIKVGKVQTYVHLFEEKGHDTTEPQLATLSRVNSRSNSRSGSP